MTRKKKKPGRKKKSIYEKLLPYTLRIKLITIQAIKAVAAERRVDKSTVIREVLEDRFGK